MSILSPEFLIIGKNGQLAKAFTEILGERAVSIGLPELNLAETKNIFPLLEKYSPKAILNAAAYTAVDKAEEEIELAAKINAEAPEIIAKFCKERNIPLLHYSTDYVFSGNGEKPWAENDPVSPLNNYGKSKLEGEKKIVAIGGKYLIFRTSWVYDGSGKNFLNTMLRLGRERETLTVVGDQYGAPTYAGDLAEYSLKVLEKADKKPVFPSGIYHMANSGITTWHGFASKIFELYRQKKNDLKVKEIVAVSSSEYKTPAKRPSNSRFNMAKLKAEFGIVMPDWQVALKNCIEKI